MRPLWKEVAFLPRSKQADAGEKQPRPMKVRKVGLGPSSSAAYHPARPQWLVSYLRNAATREQPDGLLSGQRSRTPPRSLGQVSLKCCHPMGMDIR